MKLGPCQAAGLILHVKLISDSYAHKQTKWVGNKTVFELFSQSRYLIISTFPTFKCYTYINQRTTPTKYPLVAVKAASMILFQPVNKAIWIPSTWFLVLLFMKVMMSNKTLDQAQNICSVTVSSANYTMTFFWGSDKEQSSSILKITKELNTNVSS